MAHHEKCHPRRRDAKQTGTNQHPHRVVCGEVRPGLDFGRGREVIDVCHAPHFGTSSPQADRLVTMTWVGATDEQRAQLSDTCEAKTICCAKDAELGVVVRLVHSGSGANSL
jgi:hypothetical protein